MGLEGENFLGNPNKVVYTDDELEYDSNDEGGGAFWIVGIEDHETDDISGDPVYGSLNADLEIDNDEDDDSDEDYDCDDELEIFYDSADDEEDEDDNELQLTLVNGSYVQYSPSNKNTNPTTTSNAEGASTSAVNVDNNETVAEEEASNS